MMICTADHGHERLRLELVAAGRALVAAAETEAAADLAEAREDLERFCATDLLPELRRDEVCLERAEEHLETRLLAVAMRAQIRAITAIAEELRAPSAPWVAVAATRALHAMLAAYSHHHALLSSAVNDPAAPARS